MAFDALWREVYLLTDDIVPFKPHFAREPEARSVDLIPDEGREVGLKDVESYDGILAVNGQQILLYIPDQGPKYSEVVRGNLNEGRKVHLAECRTLSHMREIGRFERYLATPDVSGEFRISGIDIRTGGLAETTSRLNVCQNCLSKLNYDGAAGSAQKRRQICVNFDFARFFETYSTLFAGLPARRSFDASAYDYTEDWNAVSDRYRASRDWRCEDCWIDLSDNRSLLHTHHRNGNKGDNVTSNLRALCVDCHRRQPHHGRMHVTHESMQVIARKRLAVDATFSDWDSVFARADLALHGALRRARGLGWQVPEPGVPDLSGDPMGVRWPSRRIALVHPASHAETPAGWRRMTPEGLLNLFA